MNHPDAEELIRRAQAAGGKVLRTVVPDSSLCTESTPVNSVHKAADSRHKPGPAQPKPSKYRAIPQIYNGVRFDSKAEARRAAELDDLADMGVWYVRQPVFHLGCPENIYRADFLVLDLQGKAHVEDVKGFETAKFLRDKKLWKAYGPCQLWIRGRNGVEYVNGGKDPEAITFGTAGQSTYHKWSDL